jgi:hypothetical protein
MKVLRGFCIFTLAASSIWASASNATEINCVGKLTGNDSIIVKSSGNISLVQVYFVDSVGNKTSDRTFEFSGLQFEKNLNFEVVTGFDKREHWTHQMSLSVSQDDQATITLYVAHGFSRIVYDKYQYKLKCGGKI